MVFLGTKKNYKRLKIVYFGPADMVGQVAGVQTSIRVLYRMFTLLKKSTAATDRRLLSMLGLFFGGQ
jgi:hypothetical protein